MYKIKFLSKSTNEIIQKEINTNDKNKAIEIYKREISINPGNYEIISIINTETEKADNQYKKIQDQERKQIIKNIESKIKLIIKNKYKYKYGNELKSYKINVKSKYFDYIKQYIKDSFKQSDINNNYIINDDIQIDIGYNTIYINAIE